MKTDKRDAQKLAALLEAGRLQGIGIPSQALLATPNPDANQRAAREATWKVNYQETTISGFRRSLSSTSYYPANRGQFLGRAILRLETYQAARPWFIFGHRHRHRRSQAGLSICTLDAIPYADSDSEQYCQPRTTPESRHFC